MEVRAYLLTWTTYGTWLPGDSRGWVDRHHKAAGDPDPQREAAARRAMDEEAVTLDQRLREVARAAIEDSATRRGWFVHALEVRSNHVHVIVSAHQVPPGRIMGTLKGYASQALNAAGPSPRVRWWTRDGSKRKLPTDEALAHAVHYVHNQDKTWLNES